MVKWKRRLDAFSLYLSENNEMSRSPGKKADDPPVLNQFQQDKYSWLLLLGLCFVVVEIIFADWGFLFPVALFGFFTYYGRKHRMKKRGVILFWIGVVGLALTVLNMIVFKLIVVAVVLFLIIDFVQSKKHPRRIRPGFDQKSGGTETEHTATLPVLLNNMWFGRQTTPESDYEWQDINIQTGLGDTVIDLSRTILPKNESVIFIRHVAGRVRILVPYGIEASLRFSVVIGELDFFERRESRMINKSVAFKTDGYDKSEQKLKIMISAISCNLEVRRI